VLAAVLVALPVLALVGWQALRVRQLRAEQKQLRKDLWLALARLDERDTAAEIMRRALARSSEPERPHLVLIRGGKTVCLAVFGLLGAALGNARKYPKAVSLASTRAVFPRELHSASRIFCPTAVIGDAALSRRKRRGTGCPRYEDLYESR
jgi:hypothetical protein